MFSSWFFSAFGFELAPILRSNSKSVALRASSVYGGHQAKHRILNWVNALFQEACARAAVGSMFQSHNPGQKSRCPIPADPCFFAITTGILFDSFSSADLYAQMRRLHLFEFMLGSVAHIISIT